MDYVEVFVSFSGITTTKRYRLEISKKHPPSGIVSAYAKDIYGASQGTINFTLPPTKNAHCMIYLKFGSPTYTISLYA